MDKTSQADLYRKRLKIYTDRLAMAVGREINGTIRRAGVEFRKTGQLDDVALRQAHQQRTATILEGFYRRIAKTSVTDAFSLVEGKGISLKNNPGDAEAFIEQILRTFLLQQGLKKAALISETTREDIIGAILEGIKEGEGSAVIARRIGKVSGFTRNRAVTIAITETFAAHSHANYAAIENTGNVFGLNRLKEWSPVIDARTRSHHADMASHPAIEMDKFFNVNGELMSRPHDPAGSADNVIRCRCVLVYDFQD